MRYIPKVAFSLCWDLFSISYPSNLLTGLMQPFGEWKADGGRFMGEKKKTNIQFGKQVASNLDQKKKRAYFKNPVLIANFFVMNRAQSLYRVIVLKKILHLCM